MLTSTKGRNLRILMGGTLLGAGLISTIAAPAIGAQATTSLPFERTLMLPASPTGTELVLRLSLRANCTIPAKISFRGRTHRLDVFPSTGVASTLLGKISKSTLATLTLAPPECALSPESVRVDLSHHELSPVLANAPCVNVRDDQYDNLYTDRARLLLPSFEAMPEDRVNNPFRDQILKYTMFFTDEDSKTSTDAVAGQRARYGRSTDIEVVSFRRMSRDGLLDIFPTYFQSGFSLYPQDRNFILRPSDCSAFSDPGHGCREFRGNSLEGTNHPIVYNSARNNVFTDQPSETQRRRGPELYCLVPSRPIPAPLAREAAMFVEPSLFRDSDEEMAREGKQPVAATEYLYVRIRGALENSLTNRGYAPALQLSNGVTRVNTDFYATIDRLGEDLFGRESFSAIPMSSRELDQLMTGELSARLRFEKVWRPNDLRVDSLRFYRLYPFGRTYRVQEITNLIRRNCDLNGAQTHCTLSGETRR